MERRKGNSIPSGWGVDSSGKVCGDHTTTLVVVVGKREDGRGI